MLTQQEPIYVDDFVKPHDFNFRDGLSYKAKKEIEFLYTFARGIMMITGDTGSGKDLFAIAIAAMNKYYFNDLNHPDKPRKILLDFYPKRAFGYYTFFNPDVMMEEIQKMAKAANQTGFETSNDPKESEFVDEATEKWALGGEGEILLNGSVLYLSELKRYCYNREPHRAVNKFIGKICTIHRHLNMLILGTHVFANEIDVNAYLQYVTCWAKCSWSLTKQNTTDVILSRGRYSLGTNVYKVIGKKKVLHIDGKAPREYLDGNSYYDLYDSWNMMNLIPTITKKGK